MSNKNARPYRRQSAGTRGFTLFELVLVVALLGMIAAITATRIVPVLTRSAAGQAVSMVASDLEQAVSLASRQRRPVRLTCDCAGGSYTVTDRVSGALLFRRVVTGDAGGLGVTQLAFSSETIDVFPTGLTSAPLTITVGAGEVQRQVAMSTGGFVRVIR